MNLNVFELNEIYSMFIQINKMYPQVSIIKLTGFFKYLDVKRNKKLGCHGSSKVGIFEIKLWVTNGCQFRLEYNKPC